MPGDAGKTTRVTRRWLKARLSAGSLAPGGNRAGHGSRGWGVVMLYWTCAWASSSLAAQVDYGVGYYLLGQSNITRTNTNSTPELTQAIMGGISVQENNSDLNARVLAQIEHRHFNRATFSDDTTAYVDGTSLWTIVPRRLTWMLNDTFREVQLSLTSPDTPGNRTKSNSLLTGPDLIFAVDSSNSAMFGGRYGRFDIQNSLSDNLRYSGYARAVHSLSPQSAVSLNYEAGRVLFEPEATTFPKILKESWYVRYEALNAGSGATVDLGTTRVTRYGADRLRGHLERLTLFKAFSTESGIRISYSDEISDTYSDLIRGITTQSSAPVDPPAVVIQGLATADLYHSKRGEVDYLNQNARFQYALQGWARKVDFETLDEDYNEKGGRFTLNWLLSGAVRFNAYGEYWKRTYLTLDREDTNRNYILGADYKLNSNLTFRLEGGVAQRESTAEGASYTDRRALLLLGYGTGPFDVRSRR